MREARLEPLAREAVDESSGLRGGGCPVPPPVGNGIGIGNDPRRLEGFTSDTVIYDVRVTD